MLGIETAHGAELVLLFISIGAVIGCIVSLRRALIDETYWITQIEASRNPEQRPELMVASGTVREESLRLAVCVLIGLFAIAALLMEPPPPSYHDLPQVLWSLVTLNGVMFLMIIKTSFRMFVRKKVEQVATQRRRRKDDA
jgi:hypothetical protein